MGYTPKLQAAYQAWERTLWRAVESWTEQICESGQLASRHSSSYRLFHRISLNDPAQSFLKWGSQTPRFQHYIRGIRKRSVSRVRGYISILRSHEILKKKRTLLWNVTPCILVYIYRYSEGKCCAFIITMEEQANNIKYVPPKCRWNFTGLYGVASKKIIAVEAPNLKHVKVELMRKFTEQYSIKFHWYSCSEIATSHSKPFLCSGDLENF